MCVPVDWLVSAYRDELDVEIGRLIPDGTTCLHAEELPNGLIKFRPAIVGDERFYEELGANSWYYQESKAEFATAVRLTQDANVLEIGAGLGAFSELAQAREYVGLETSGAATERARALGRDVRQETAEEHLAAGSQRVYDVVCGFQLLEHVPDPVDFLKTCAQLARSNGWVVMSVPAEESFVGLSVNNVLNMPPHHQTRWTKQALESVGREAGLRTIALVHEDLDPIHEQWAMGIALGQGDPDALVHTWSRAGYFLQRTRERLVRQLVPEFRTATQICFKGHTLTAVFQVDDT